MWILFVAFDAFIAGLASAWLARSFLQRPISVFGDWFVLRHAENPGIAFGMRIPSPWQDILVIGALIAVAMVAARSKTLLSHIGYGLILGGALANIVDRFQDGTVTDYFAVGSFPVFNVPDSCITVGVVLLLVESIGLERFLRRKP